MMKVDVTWKRMKSPAVSDAGGFVLFFFGVFSLCKDKVVFLLDCDLSRCSHRIFNIYKEWSHLGSFTKDWTHFLETELSHFSQYLQILICDSLLSMSTGTICLSTFLLGKLLGRLGDTSHQICTFLLGDVTCVLIAFRWLRWSEAWHMEASRWWSWWGGNDGMAWRVCALYWVLWWEEKKRKK